MNPKKAAAVGALVAALLGTAACPASSAYDSCDEARKAGAAPLHKGDEGWNPQLDGDGDGVACEVKS